MYCDMLGTWLVVNIRVAGFPVGGAMPCEYCHGIHQVIQAEQEDAMRPIVPVAVRPAFSAAVAFESGEKPKNRTDKEHGAEAPNASGTGDGAGPSVGPRDSHGIGEGAGSVDGGSLDPACNLAGIDE
jgi:hypothetical protein